MKTIKYKISKKLSDTIFGVTLLIVAAIIVQHIEIKQSKEMQDILYRLDTLEKTKPTLKRMCNE
ncbi:MAG: hypothetical protein COB12_04740 [Flavobacterium sp.]|nr:MAG: hypothetical protein COB12_04740 [Flavobacterium sp.]